jgi:hypothetical protein
MNLKLTTYGPLKVCLAAKPEVCGKMEKKIICENLNIGPK